MAKKDSDLFLSYLKEYGGQHIPQPIIGDFIPQLTETELAYLQTDLALCLTDYPEGHPL